MDATDWLNRSAGVSYVLLSTCFDQPSSEISALAAKHPDRIVAAAKTKTKALMKSREGADQIFREEWQSYPYRAPLAARDRAVSGALCPGFRQCFSLSVAEKFLPQVALWRKVLNTVPDELAHRIAHGNAERLWGFAAVQ